MKKIISIIIACFMVLSVGVLAFANDTPETPPLTPEPATHTITFNTNGIKEIAAKAFKTGEKIELPDTDVDGYYFLGWYEDAEHTKIFKETVMPDKDITIYSLYAIKLSNLTSQLETLGLEALINATGLTKEQFDAVAKATGIEFVFNINNKEYKVNKLSDLVKEVEDVAKEKIDYLKSTEFKAIFTCGPDQKQTLTFELFNDLIKKNDTPETTTQKEVETTTEKKVEKEPTKEKEKSNIPDTGSSIIAAIAAIAISVSSGTALLTKKKDDLN